jgi:hypothetical protein
MAHAIFGHPRHAFIAGLFRARSSVRSRVQ